VPALIMKNRIVIKGNHRGLPLRKFRLTKNAKCDIFNVQIRGLENMKTKMIKNEEVVHDWFVVNVADKVLGRVSTLIASMLSGKDRPDYTPNVDNGAGVVVLNCGKIRVTGKKESQKVYKRFSGYPSGQKEVVYKKMFEKSPEYIIRHSIRGMLPKNKLGDKMIKRLKLYVGEEHSQTAQKPIEKKI